MAGAAAQVTVSTVGLVPEMQEFMARSRAQLAVSLHATTDEVPPPPRPLLLHVCCALQHSIASSSNMFMSLTGFHSFPNQQLFVLQVQSCRHC